MDHLERMFRVLVQTIRGRFPQYLSAPFDVAELHQDILPYRHHRAELGFDTNEDYEIALLELLSGARGYLIVDQQMRDVLGAELAARNPDPAAFRQFAHSQVALSPEAVRRLKPAATRETAPRPSVPPAGSPAAEPASVSGTLPSGSAAVAAPVSSPAPTASAPVAPRPSAVGVVPEAGDKCRSCGEQLPAGRPITFCPHCGQNLTTVNCQACGAELELGWRFCPSCGRPAATR